ncbi:MAG: AAA family ATPase [Candidatus Sericytochromatia bacterium]|nr:AAA family ATPase [Candidatus Sericytochromatia bacterium]
MYIDRIQIENFRTFGKTDIRFCHPDRRYSSSDSTQNSFPQPQLPNLNLLLGNNGLGKTTLLKAIALSALGPAVRSSGIYANHLVRRDVSLSQPQTACLNGFFVPHPQDRVPVTTPKTKYLNSTIQIVRKGDLEEFEWMNGETQAWDSIYSSSSDAFFFVGYGATRRVEQRERVDLSGRRGSSFVRAQRIQSLFEEAYSLLPLNTWLPEFRHSNPGRYKQVVNLINRLMGDGHYQFQGELEAGEYLFEKGGLKIPFPDLSDGYRAFLGWVGDLLYHICMTAPKGKKLTENQGIVMVDEIDLHLHPKWQMTVLKTLATALPQIQFIVTSHSPLLVGAVEWMNILVMEPGRKQSSKAIRLKQAVHGLDADQILLTEFFGMESTRSAGKQRDLKKLSLMARAGDTEAATQLLIEMSRGLEPLA